MRHGIYQKNLKNVRSHLTADIFRYMMTMVFDIASLFYLLLFGKVMEAMFSFKINTECKLPQLDTVRIKALAVIALLFFEKHSGKDTVTSTPLRFMEMR